LLLSDFESDLLLSLNESQSITEFDKNIQEKFELKYGKSELKSSIIDENFSEKELLISKALFEFKASLYYGYDEVNIDGSKEEFFEYLENRKANFVNEVELMSFLDNQNEKDIMIALMYIEVGTFETLANYFDEIIALDQAPSKTDFKSVNSCNWWCRTKKYAECVLLTQGTAMAAVLTIFGPPPVDILAGFVTCGISLFALNCWEEFFNL